MDWSAIGKDAISAGVNTILGLFGYNNQLNDQKQLMAQQYQYQKDFYNYTYNLNSPANQVARLKRAGLNPALAYGQVQNAGGTTGSQPNASAPQMKMGQVDFNLAENMQLQNELLKEDVRSKRLDNDEKEDNVSTPDTYRASDTSAFYDSSIEGNNTVVIPLDPYKKGREIRRNDAWAQRNYERKKKNNDFIEQMKGHELNMLQYAFDIKRIDMDLQGLNELEKEGVSEYYQRIRKLVADADDANKRLEYTKLLIDSLGLQNDYQRIVNEWQPWMNGTIIAEKIGNLIINGIKELIPTGKILNKLSDFLSLTKNVN